MKESLASAVPQAVVVDGTPGVELVIDGAVRGLRLRCEAPPEISPTDFERLNELHIARSPRDPRWLEISIHTEELFPYFLAFASTVADAVQLDGRSIKAAITQSLRLFRRLTRDTAMLSAERWLGLLGELWVLDRLVAAKGADALAAWLGPNAEKHDFRIGSRELEVKTTRSQKRQHIINGLDQLAPSPSSDLYIVSLQYTAAGLGDAGRITLSQAIHETRERLAPFDQAETFSAVLIDRFSLVPETEARYSDLLKHRTEPRLIHVTDRTPQLVRADMALLQHDDMYRVLDATYVLNCEGLGYADGDVEFLAVLP